MDIEAKLQELSSLQKAVEDKNTEIQEFLKSQLIPFIKQSGGRCEYDGYSSTINIIIDDKDKECEFIELLSKACGLNGFYHFGVEVAPGVSFNYDDGVLSVRFRFSGKAAEIKEKFKQGIKLLKELGIRVDFTKAIGDQKITIFKAEQRIKELNELFQ